MSTSQRIRHGACTQATSQVARAKQQQTNTEKQNKTQQQTKKKDNDLAILSLLMSIYS